MALHCEHYSDFQNALKKMREIDDKIIYSLNNSIPTESFKGQVNSETTCRTLYDELKLGHKNREEAIKACILQSANKLKTLKEKRENDRDDFELDKTFKFEQRKFRSLQSELNVEDIIKKRSFKAFNEKCRIYFDAEAS